MRAACAILPEQKDPKTMKAKFLTLVICAIALTGCNTVAGVGKDMKKAGQAIEKAAN